MLYTLLITIGVTGWICRRIDDERPLSTLPAVLWAELGTPRRSQYDQLQTTTVSWVGLTFVLTAASGPADRRHPPGLLSIPPPTVPAGGRRPGVAPAGVVVPDAA